MAVLDGRLEKNNLGGGYGRTNLRGRYCCDTCEEKGLKGWTRRSQHKRGASVGIVRSEGVLESTRLVVDWSGLEVRSHQVSWDSNSAYEPQG